MKCLIDFDILIYEIGSCAEYEDEETGEHVIRNFDYAAELLDQRIREIEEECWSDQPSCLYITGSEYLINKYTDEEYKPNFRIAVATVKPYKGNRKPERPYHANNLIAYAVGMYETKFANGIEADDLLMIDSIADPDNTIICTRDKDLRQAGKHHFGWPCGKQPQFGPKIIDSFGSIELSANKKTIKGEGIKFFYSQLLTGDAVDNIPGLPGCGPAKTFQLLDELETEEDLCETVKAAYAGKYADEWGPRYREQRELLWMLREMPNEG